MPAPISRARRLASRAATVHHPRMHRHAISAALGLLLPLCAAAQQSDSAASTAPDRPQPLSPRITPAIGLHYGSPMRFSGALGVVVDLNRRTLDGILLVVEPGQKGIEYSVGYLRTIGRFGSGVSVRASVLHTFDEPWDADARTNYVGGELHWMVALGVGGRAGLFKRVGHGEGTHETLTTLGLSIGI
jgi:hypothetical protein